MAITSAANVSEVIEKVVSTLVTETLIQESIMIGAMRDFSSLVRPGMDRLDIPLFNELAVQDVDDAGGAMTPQTIDPTAAQLELSRHKAVPFSLPKKVSIESKINLVEVAVRNGARSLTAEIDDAAIAEGVANAGTTVAVAAADALQAILDAKQQMDSDNIPMDRRFIISSPVFTADLLGTNNVIRANEFGNSDGIQRGMLTDIYGFRVLMSSSASLPANGFLAMHQEGIAFARQRNVEFMSEEKVLEQRDDYVLVHKYGVESSAASNPRLYEYAP